MDHASLPVTSADQHETNGNPSDGHGITAGMTVLIVDDDVEFREAFEALLSEIPDVAHVFSATAQDAVELIQVTPPDLILVDCRARFGMNVGLIQMLRRLRTLAPSSFMALMCLYPERIPHAARTVLDRTIHKNMSFQELDDLVRDVPRG